MAKHTRKAPRKVHMKRRRSRSTRKQQGGWQCGARCTQNCWEESWTDKKGKVHTEWVCGDHSFVRVGKMDPRDECEYCGCRD